MANPLIVGAGLSGLLTACAFENPLILERDAGPIQRHKALLRFPDRRVAELTGIDMSEARVIKAIYPSAVQHSGAYLRQLEMMYADKVIGVLSAQRSIAQGAAWRYIPPDDFYHQLVAKQEPNIVWRQNILFDFHKVKRDMAIPVISTLPLPGLAHLLPEEMRPEFISQPIRVRRYRLMAAVRHQDKYKTVYNPTHITPIYRITLHGDLITVELTGSDGACCPTDQHAIESDLAAILLEEFDIDDGDYESLDVGYQRLGKISPITAEAREEIVEYLAEKYNIHLVGRFARWSRETLTDSIDVIHDIKRRIS